MISAQRSVTFGSNKEKSGKKEVFPQDMGTELTPSLGLGTRGRRSKATGLPRYPVSLISAEQGKLLPLPRRGCLPGWKHCQSCQTREASALLGSGRGCMQSRALDTSADVSDTPRLLVVRSWSWAVGDASFIPSLPSRISPVSGAWKTGLKSPKRRLFCKMPGTDQIRIFP